MSIANNCSFTPHSDANGTFASPSAAVHIDKVLAARCTDELSAHYAAMARLAYFICYQVLGAPISALGVIGNAISIAVLTRRSMMWGLASTNCYLVALACSDMLYLLILNFGVLGALWQRVNADYDLENLFYASGHATGIEQPASVEAATSTNGTRVTSVSASSSSALQWQPHPYTIAAVNVLSNTSIWVVVAFTIERYVAVTYPIRGRVLCNPSRAKWIIGATCIVVLLLHLPNFFELDADSGEETTMAQHPVYRIGYNWGVLAFLFAVLPMALLVVFNSLLIRSVSRAVAVRRTMTRGFSDSSSLTSTACIGGVGCGNSGNGGGGYGRPIVIGGGPTAATATTAYASAQPFGPPAAAAAAATAERQQRSVTVMLVAVVMIFFLLHAPNAIVLVKTTYEDYARQRVGVELSPLNRELRRVASAAVNFLTLLSSSVNFLLYSALSRKFRQTLRGLSCGSTAVVAFRRATPATATATACEATTCENLEVGWVHDRKNSQKGKRQSLLPLQDECLTKPGNYKVENTMFE